MSMTIGELSEIKRTIDRRLAELRISAARTGINTPPEKNIEIKDLTEASEILNVCIMQDEDLDDDNVSYIRGKLKDLGVQI